MSITPLQGNRLARSTIDIGTCVQDQLCSETASKPMTSILFSSLDQQKSFSSISKPQDPALLKIVQRSIDQNFLTDPSEEVRIELSNLSTLDFDAQEISKVESAQIPEELKVKSALCNLLKKMASHQFDVWSEEEKNLLRDLTNRYFEVAFKDPREFANGTSFAEIFLRMYLPKIRTHEYDKEDNDILYYMILIMRPFMGRYHLDFEIISECFFPSGDHSFSEYHVLSLKQRLDESFYFNVILQRPLDHFLEQVKKSTKKNNFSLDEKCLFVFSFSKDAKLDMSKILDFFKKKNFTKFLRMVFNSIKNRDSSFFGNFNKLSAVMSLYPGKLSDQYVPTILIEKLTHLFKTCEDKSFQEKSDNRFFQDLLLADVWCVIGCSSAFENCLKYLKADGSNPGTRELWDDLKSFGNNPHYLLDFATMLSAMFSKDQIKEKLGAVASDVLFRKQSIAEMRDLILQIGLSLDEVPISYTEEICEKIQSLKRFVEELINENPKGFLDRQLREIRYMCESPTPPEFLRILYTSQFFYEFAPFASNQTWLEGIKKIDPLVFSLETISSTWAVLRRSMDWLISTDFRKIQNSTEFKEILLAIDDLKLKPDYEFLVHDLVHIFVDSKNLLQLSDRLYSSFHFHMISRKEDELCRLTGLLENAKRQQSSTKDFRVSSLSTFDCINRLLLSNPYLKQIQHQIDQVLVSTLINFLIELDLSLYDYLHKIPKTNSKPRFVLENTQEGFSEIQTLDPIQSIRNIRQVITEKFLNLRSLRRNLNKGSDVYCDALKIWNEVKALQDRQNLLREVDKLVDNCAVQINDLEKIHAFVNGIPPESLDFGYFYDKILTRIPSFYFRNEVLYGSKDPH